MALSVLRKDRPKVINVALLMQIVALLCGLGMQATADHFTPHMLIGDLVFGFLICMVAAGKLWAGMLVVGLSAIISFVLIVIHLIPTAPVNSTSIFGVLQIAMGVLLAINTLLLVSSPSRRWFHLQKKKIK